MTERPILFSAPMVRAIFSGMKSQTRRVMKPRPEDGAIVTVGEIGTSRGAAYVRGPRSGGLTDRIPCPYGSPGDQLWVRETWGVYYDEYVSDCLHEPTWYRADYTPEQESTMAMPERWRPSIHMPRARSRITLEIVGVRVERLQDISEADAIAEGVTPSIVGGYLDHLQYRAGYQTLWESINGAGSWDANPWVWVIEFRRV
ncbi:MAG: hypothetical protein Q8M09_12390 [Pseudomonadota bacterium]|nr:hypothetical protein [Pseudomonadota bacterium]MDP1905026.1 hypothetical protein [Pseudomonadota bacterium]MDP2354268.1 hypothetical protein [Pseudomonadota bacterium]